MIYNSLINQLAMDYATRKTQEDIENGNLMDFPEMDFNQFTKQVNSNYLQVIESYIKLCDINGDFNTLDNKLEEYANKHINEKFPFMDLKTIGEIVSNNYSQTFVDLLEPKLQAFILYVELLRDLHFYLDKKYIKKIKSVELDFINYFISYSTELLVGIDTLLLSKNHNSIVSLYRTFYENYIVFSYLQKYPKLISPYLEHIKVDEFKLAKLHSEIYGDKVSEELETKYNELIRTYGKDYNQDYGWANLSESKDYVNLKAMYEDLQLDAQFNYYYQLSCKYTHSTTFSLSIKPTLDDLVLFLNAIVDINSKEFELLFEKIKFKTPKEERLIRKWIKVISEDVLKRLAI